MTVFQNQEKYEDLFLFLRFERRSPTILDRVVLGDWDKKDTEELADVFNITFNEANKAIDNALESEKKGWD